jgi:hypothetical protein
MSTSRRSRSDLLSTGIPESFADLPLAGEVTAKEPL